MVAKRSTTKRRVTNLDLHQIVADNHADTCERLARMETLLAPLAALPVTQLTGLPEKVERLEAWRNRLAGAWAFTVILFGSYLKFFKGH